MGEGMDLSKEDMKHRDFGLKSLLEKFAYLLQITNLHLRPISLTGLGATGPRYTRAHRRNEACESDTLGLP